MANTHDYIIANATGSTVRADLNTLFLEVEKSNSGDSLPSAGLVVGKAGKLWMDTTTDTLKYYTGSDWVSVARQVKGSANDTDITGTIDPAASTTVPGVSTIFTNEAKIGDKLVVSSETRTITAIASDTSLTVDVAFSNNSNDATPEIHPAAFVVTDDGGGIDLLVDTDGKVGVNCATPGAQVDVRGPTGTGTASAGVLRLSTSELTVADADQLGRIEFIAPLEASGTDAILVGASIYAEADDTFAADNNATDLVFATGASEAATERMRITSAGAISFSDGNITNVGNIALDTISSDAGTSIGVTLGTDAGDDFNVGSGKLIVEGDTGKVGIGTTAPGSLLDIRGDAVTAAQDCIMLNGSMRIYHKNFGFKGAGSAYDLFQVASGSVGEISIWAMHNSGSHLYKFGFSFSTNNKSFTSMLSITGYSFANSTFSMDNSTGQISVASGSYDRYFAVTVLMTYGSGSMQ